MSATAVALPPAVQAYTDAWNRRDPEGIVGSLREGGTYADPATGGPLSEPAIASYAEGLFRAFPDLHFDVLQVAGAESDRVILRWLMRGTNTGPLQGGPPTGASVSLPGVDFVELIDGEIASVEGIFDRQSMLQQLGLQVIVSPYRVGPVVFGNSVHLESPARGRPGAFSLTAIDARSDAEAEAIRDAARRMLPDMARMRGFMGLLAARVGHRLFTVTAWEQPDDAGQLRSNEVHTGAVRSVHTGELGGSGYFSTWVPRSSTTSVRCRKCQRWARLERECDRCACGEQIGPLPPSW